MLNSYYLDPVINPTLTNTRVWCDAQFLSQTDVVEMCGGHAGAVAQHLALLELERMSYIGPEEFVVSYMRANSHALFHGKHTDNLESYVAWTKRLSRIIATEICKVSCTTVQAKYLIQLLNFPEWFPNERYFSLTKWIHIILI